ncbi:MAG: hypothetical protein C0434_17400 [Xanthomonadaceae bacterium]|nr:hypothetical protein [Xanthomonadaceae bacterium]
MHSSIKTLFIAVGSLVIAAGCAGKNAEPVTVLDTDTGQEVVMTSKQAADADARVCTKENVVGTRFPVTQCTTQAERDARRRQAQEDHDSRQRRTSIRPNS